MNEQFLQHKGATDVITFDLRHGFDSPEVEKLELAGEIYICPREAERQAKEFGTTLSEETVRYIVHGILHLQGYDDLNAVERKAMKREENKLVGSLARRFDLAKVCP